MLRIISFFLFFITLSAKAEFSRNSVTYLSGKEFEVGEDRERTEMTFESLNIFDYGDSFFWMDVTSPHKTAEDNRTTAMYGEWAPRILITKISDYGIYLAGNFEFGNNSFGQVRSNLYGLGINLKVPGAKFFNYHLYVRDNLDKRGTSLQSTIVYNFPFDVFGRNLALNAFVDLVHSSEGEGSNKTLAHINTAQQILYSLHEKFAVGFEYHYWSKKFGGTTAPEEKNLKALVQWVF